MSADNYIEKLRQKNPGLLAANRIAMSVNEFEAQIRMAYLRGALDATEPLKKTSGDMPDFFRSIFEPIRKQ